MLWKYSFWLRFKIQDSRQLYYLIDETLMAMLNVQYVWPGFYAYAKRVCSEIAGTYNCEICDTDFQQHKFQKCTSLQGMQTVG